MNLQKIKTDLQLLAEEVGRYLWQEFLDFDFKDVESKSGHNDLVSFVDKEAEKRILEGLKIILPGSDFLAEESQPGKSPLDSELYWIVDPLDGTTNFSHGLPIFSISIALMVDQVIRLGMVYEVGRKECFTAVKGEGAFLDNLKIKVSDQKLKNQALLVTGFPYTAFPKMDNYFNAIRSFLKETHGIRRLGSAAVDLSYVACGRFEGFFEYNLNPWDVAAGALLVEEAGGVVSDFSGKKNYLFGGEIFAANDLHGNLLEMFQNDWNPN
jgi:myo-inositol-1(or 4)-monophosphatase